MSDIQVSVICNTYNHEKYIRDALDGFVSQKTNFDFEVLIHDDASIDNTAEIIREYEKKYPKIIKPIYETENQWSKHDGSLTRIQNDRAKGKYIALCEGDDFWIDEYKLQKQFDALESHPECSACFGKVLCCNEDGSENKLIYPSCDIEEGIISLEQFIYIYYMIQGYCFQTSGYFIKRDVVDYAITSLYRQYLNGDETYLRACFEKGPCYYIEKPLSCYRMFSKGSWSERNKLNASFKEKVHIVLRKRKGDDFFDKSTNYRFHDIIVKSNFLSAIEMIVEESQKENKKYLMKSFNISLFDFWLNGTAIVFRIKKYIISHYPLIARELKKIKKYIKGKNA